MGSLWKTALCLLFLSISSSGQFAKFSCSDVTEIEYHENTAMSCKSSMEITKVTVTRCESCNECNKSSIVINTIAGINSSERGRIFSEKGPEGQVFVLHIQKTKMSDQGGYKWYLSSDNGHKELCTTLKIRAPETEPTLTMNRTELTCLSASGHKARQIYWFNGNGTNLTDSSSMVSEKVEDGLTRVTSTLVGKPSLTALTYCCTVLYDVHTRRNKTTCLSKEKVLKAIDDNEPDIPKRSKEHTITILVLLFLVLCSFATVLYYKYRQREVSRRNWPELVRTLFPILQPYEKPEENSSKL